MVWVKIKLPENEKRNLELLIERLDEFGSKLQITNREYNSTKVSIVLFLWGYESSAYDVGFYWQKVLEINNKHFERDMSPAAIELRKWHKEHEPYLYD